MSYVFIESLTEEGDLEMRMVADLPYQKKVVIIDRKQLEDIELPKINFMYRLDLFENNLNVSAILVSTRYGPEKENSLILGKWTK